MVLKTIAGIVAAGTLIVAAFPVSAAPVFEGSPYESYSGGEIHYWEGETSFSCPDPTTNMDLAGYVDWIVYGPSSPYLFPSQYEPGGSVTPSYTPSLGEYVYVYQITSTGGDNLHSFSVDLEALANNIGAFNVGIAPKSNGMTVNSGDADWDFDDGLANGGSSQMLALCSFFSPEQLWGDAIDGVDADVEPLPGPNPSVTITVPEPSMLCLALVGLVSWVAARVVRRRR
jgi:hypothetical protein